MASTHGSKKPKKGRPAADTEPVNLRLPRDLLDALDTFRRDTSDLPNRPEAIRRLLRDHLIGLGLLDSQS